MREILYASIMVLLIVALLSGCAHRKGTYPELNVSIQNLHDTVSYLSSMDSPRSYNNLESLHAAAEYISRKFREYGLKPEEQAFRVNGITYVNIVAGVGPREGERLIVGAHYDVCCDQPGADDNASGIAGLLEIARLAKEHEKQLPLGIDFVAYSLEEPPFFGTKEMGSYFHAESLQNNKVPVRGMISLEMIGYFSDKEKSQEYPLSLMKLFYPSVGNFIGVVSNFGSSSLARQMARHMRAANVDVRTLLAPSLLPGVDFSDHRNYWAFGNDAVMITDTAFYRNPNYHMMTDTIDTLSFDKMAEVVKGVCWALLNMK